MNQDSLLPSLPKPRAERDFRAEGSRRGRLQWAAAGVIMAAIVTSTLCATSPAPGALSSSDWSSIRAAYEAGRHAIRLQDDGTHAARNPGQQWRATFDGRGFLVTPDEGSWTWGLQLESCSGEELAEKSPPISANGSTIAYHWSELVDEWYRNDRHGLEQGWTIKEAASPDGGLTLSFRVRGGLVPLISTDGRSVAFQVADGSTAVTYGGLEAWDADGTALKARFIPAEDTESLAIEVDATQATYPITIDPVAQQQAYLKAADAGAGGAGDEFGFSVAISGDTVVVGAPKEDSIARGVNGDQGNNGAADSGAAYVFVRSGGTWSQQAYLKASNTEAEDQFGISVAISGDTLVVGALIEDSAATGVNGDENDNTAGGAGAAYVFVRNGMAWSLEAYLKASNTGANDSFGRSVAVEGDTVIVGAPAEDSADAGVGGGGTSNAAVDSGAVYVFTRSGTTWSQEAYVKASNPGGSARFGHSVSISGDTMVAGAFQEDTSAGNSGAAYVFTRSMATWSQQAFLKAANPGPNDFFGSSVGVSGDTVVVGAQREDSAADGVNGNGSDNSALDAGAAYVFTRSGTAWSEQAYLKASTSEAGDYFGSAVAVDGDTVVVGAEREDSNATGVGGDESDNSAVFAGAAYVFTRSGTTWSLGAYLKASNTGGSDLFGISVGISGDTVIAGASLEDGVFDSSAGSGATYAFVWNGSGWIADAYLKARSPGTGDLFGTAVAHSGDTAVVGAPFEDSAATGVNGDAGDNSLANSGAAYVFVRNGTTWSQEAYLKPPPGRGGDFGRAVAISGDTVVVGPGAYVFVRSGTTWTFQTELVGSNTEGSDQFGAAVGISGETVVVGAPGEASAATGVNQGGSDNSLAFAGAAYVFVRSGTNWTEQAYLKASNTGFYDYFGLAVAVSGDTVVVGAPAEDSTANGVNGNQDDGPDLFPAIGGIQYESGAAYVFERSEGSWSQGAYLKASNTGPGDLFGWAVAVSGDTILVGSPGEDSPATGVNGSEEDASNPTTDPFNGYNPGAAYLFVWDGASWSQEAYLKPSNTGRGDAFGEGVAISGDTAVVGADAEDSPATGVNGDGSINTAGASGAAYLFVRSGTVWGEEAYLKASNAGAGDAFGTAVAVDGTTVVIGAPNEDSMAAGVNGGGGDDAAANSGAAYVFVIPPGPEIRLEYPPGTVLTDGSAAAAFGPILAGEDLQGFVVSNIGTADLTGIAVTIGGADAAEFALSSLPVGALTPGSRSAFTVRFSPPASYASGLRMVSVDVASDDADEDPYSVGLSGMTLSLESDTDGDGLNDASEFQLADFGFDWGVEQSALVDTLFGNLGGARANLNGIGYFTESQVQELYIDTPLIAGDPDAGTATLTMWVEKSDNMGNFFLFPMTDPQTTINGLGQLEFEFPLEDGAAFFKVGTSGD